MRNPIRRLIGITAVLAASGTSWAQPIAFSNEELSALVADAQLQFPDEELSAAVMYPSYTSNDDGGQQRVAIHLMPYEAIAGLEKGKVVDCDAVEDSREKCRAASIRELSYLRIDGQSFLVQLRAGVSAELAMTAVDGLRQAAWADSVIGEHLRTGKTLMVVAIIVGPPLLMTVGIVPGVGQVVASRDQASGEFRLSLKRPDRNGADLAGQPGTGEK